ncbi:AMP-binding protein [Pseudomonas sp. S31]|uniref:class I adenylate-forming enzyme family protein n=1 Tax=Pseudomonas sp. S31 TaxID=1564473 RepID=UPI001911A9DD|nr:AMP-binding protein [Pseudomonas sp. S31]MBK4999694.1 AMP-binding protein [Pseudomonas sp. S31]
MDVDIYEDKPWLSRYATGLPKTISPEHDSLLTALQGAVAKSPELPLIHYFDGTMTLRQLDEASSRLAMTLIANGFMAGDTLGLYLQNDPAFVIGQLACWKAGGVAVAINPMNKARELAFILQDCGARALLCLDALYSEVAEQVLAQGAVQVSLVVTTSMLDGQSTHDARVLDDRQRRPVAAGVLDLQAITDARSSLEGFLPARPAAHDVAMLTYTSGTTGKPKGAMNTHGNLVFNAQAYRDWVGLTPDDKILGIAPLFHVTGSVVHVALALLTCCPLILTHRFHPGVILDVIRQQRPTFTIGAITAFQALMNAPGASRADFACFRAIFTGGAPVSPATLSAFEDFSGVYLHNAFGMTETCSATHLVPFGQRAPVDPRSGAISIGVPVFNTSVRIVDDEGAVVPVGEEGEIVDCGPQVMKGYWGQPEITSQALVAGWLRTGDVGFMDAQGWFYLVDRKKDMINVSGYKVWPREVEDVLYEHPAVFEAIVVGISDSYRGETVKAIVSLQQGMGATEAALIEHCKARLAAYKYPRQVEIVDSLPKSASGKLLRRAFR